MNIFERASRAALRYKSSQGELNTDQLWQLPLTSTGNKASLDAVAQTVARELRDADDLSFVNPKPTLHKIRNELRLDILKHIIADKQKRVTEQLEARDRAARREQLLAALANKEAAELSSMDKADILKQLENLETE